MWFLGLDCGLVSAWSLDRCYDALELQETLMLAHGERLCGLSWKPEHSRSFRSVVVEPTEEGIQHAIAEPEPQKDENSRQFHEQIQFR